MVRFRLWPAALVLCVGIARGAEARPNVLFIAVDDLRPELGCYGCKEIVTPHIDALASEGVTFTRAYCQQAVCNPSRASLMTGLRPDATRVWDLVTHFRDTIPDVVTLPQHFRSHGYYAVAYGKIYHNSLPDPKSWDEPNHWPQKATLWSELARKQLADHRRKMRSEGKSDAAIRRVRAPATEIRDVADGRMPDGEIADQAIAAMRKLTRTEKPFFLAVGFIRPHLPFVAPRKYWDLYERERIPLATPAALPAGAPAYAMNTMYELRDYCDFAGTPTPREGALSVDRQRRLKHGYYASVSFVDAQVGRLLEAAKTLGVGDSTVVVLWGDHGWKLGEHRSWCKQTNYEIDTRVPLIILSGLGETKGRRCDALVEFIDIYPTLCDLCGVPKPAHLQGRSMVPLLADPGVPWKKAAFSQFRRRTGNGEVMGYAMRTERYRFVDWRNRRNGETVATELYDHKDDPGEHTNIASRAENRDLVQQLDSELWQTLPEPPPWSGRSQKPRPKLAFVNGLDEPVVVYWLPEGGGRRKAGRIAPGEWLYQNTTLGHRFRAEGTKSDFRRTVTVDGAERTVTLQRTKDLYPVTAPPPAMKLDPFYRKYVDAHGYPIVASGRVNDYALKEAACLVDLMLAKRPDVREAMVRSGSRLIVMAHDELTTHVPEYSHLRPREHWDRRARGLGGSRTDPVCSCAEENLLAYPGDPYAAECILIHEFAHNIHLRGLVRVDKTFDKRLKAAYDRAMGKGLWKTKYAAQNHHEYFAEGVQSWFDDNRENDHDHNHVDTRKELCEYDPGLAAICREVFGETELAYTKPTTRLHDHLKGYDPTKAPTFKWPERLNEAHEKIMREVRNRGKNGK